VCPRIGGSRNRASSRVCDHGRRAGTIDGPRIFRLVLIGEPLPMDGMMFESLGDLFMASLLLGSCARPTCS